MAKKPVKPAPKKTAKKKASPVAVTRAKKVVPKKPAPEPVKVAPKPVALTKKEEALLGPRMLTKEQLARFREMILTKRKETLEELDTLKESMMDVQTGEYISESSNYSLHMEQGTDAMEREKTFLFASRGSKFIIQLDDALTRIEGGTFGQCKTCGLLIPKERLEAVLTAQTCAEYKNTNQPCERGRIWLAYKKQAK
jgi:RNA polymerase-binding transcription factor DksA